MAARGAATVIGGGVIGLASAYYLARDGWTVSVVERADVGAGASWGNAGLVVPSHSVPLAAPGVIGQGLRWLLDPESPFYIRPRLDPALARWLWQFRRACTAAHVARALPVLRDLARASLALYRELAGPGGVDVGFEERGALMVFRTPEGLAAGRHEADTLAAAGVAARVLDADAARALEPALAPGVVGGVFFPEDAQVVPDRLVTGLAAAAEGLGVRIHRATEVLGLAADGPRVRAVETTRGDLEADLVVLAAGAWSPALARTLGLRLPVQAAKGYSVTWRRPAGGPERPLLLGEARAAVTPMGDRLRVAGTLELGGLDMAIDRRRVRAVARAAAGYVAGTEDLALLEIWRGLRPCTPDGLPLVGRTAHHPNLIVATGHAMVGVSLAPATGRLVAQLAAGEPPLVDPGPLRPERFG